MVAHPDIGQCLSFLFFGLALLLVSQPVAVYHLTHSITSAVGSLLPEVSHLKACFHSGRREWQSPRMGRLALSPRYRTVSLFPFLRTCIAAGEPASSSVSSHSLNHLSSWVLAARSKPFKSVLPFRPKGMAKSQNGQACIVA